MYDKSKLGKLIPTLSLVVSGSLSMQVTAGAITTLFDSNNGGSEGGAVYFNVSVGGQALQINGFETNTGESVIASGFEVFTLLGSAEGNETDFGAWTLRATGSVAGVGRDNPSVVSLDNTFILNANTTYGFALVMPETMGHDYTNGTCEFAYGSDGNCEYSNVDLTLNLGTASNSPFTGGLFQPRVWNGTIEYTAVSAPTAAWLIGPALLGLYSTNRRKLRS